METTKVKEYTLTLTNLVISLVTKLISHNYYIDEEIEQALNDFINHLFTMHKITLFNIERLIEGFIMKKINHQTIKQCTYHDKGNIEYRCLVSNNWGKQKDWNMKNARINKTVYSTFSSLVIHLITHSGFGDKVKQIIKSNDNDFQTIELIELDISATALQRISSEYQVKAMRKDSDDDFTGLIKSINKKSGEVAKYITEGFNQVCDFVYLKPIKGKANWTTLLFRVPHITNLFVELYKQTGKKLVAKIDGKNTILNLIGLQSAITKGLETTYQEKVIGYIPNAYNRNMNGHFTQLLQFAFGLFQIEANELVSMIVDSSKGKISKDYLESCILSATNGIINYKNSFLLGERALKVYRAKLVEFGELIRLTDKYEEQDTSVNTTVCKGLKIKKSWNFCPVCAVSIKEHN